MRTALPEASDELTQVVLERAGASPLYAEQLAAMLNETALPIAGGARSTRRWSPRASRR